jgi:hypothetical protein
MIGGGVALLHAGLKIGIICIRIYLSFTMSLIVFPLMVYAYHPKKS